MSETNTSVTVVTPVISAAAIYASGDAVGGKLTFEGALLTGKGTGIVADVVIVDNDKENAPMDLVLFSSDFTATADNAAFDPSDADMLTCLGRISILSTDYASFNDNSVATVRGASAMLGVKSDEIRSSGGFTGKLYGQLVVRSTPTYTAVNDITVKLTVLQD